MTFKQILALLLGLGLVASHAWVYHLGGQEAQLNAEKRITAEMIATAKLVAEERAKAQQAEEKLRAALNEPKAAPEIRMVVRENPSKCVIPKPVDDRVREAGSKANSDIRSSL